MFISLDVILQKKNLRNYESEIFSPYISPVANKMIFNFILTPNTMLLFMMLQVCIISLKVISGQLRIRNNQFVNFH